YSFVSSHRLTLLMPHASVVHPELHSFPTRRSSDLTGSFDLLPGHPGPGQQDGARSAPFGDPHDPVHVRKPPPALRRKTIAEVCADRKSTRLNSSHVSISYAVFC